MRNGKLEPKKDAETLLRIYRKIGGDGLLLRPLTIDEQVLIFALSRYIGDMKEDKE